MRAQNPSRPKTRGARREAHISAEPLGTQAPTRVPRPHGYQKRPQDHQPSPREGPQAAFGLSAKPPRAGTEAQAGKAPVSERAGLRIIPMKRRQDFLAASRGRRAVRPSVLVQARQREQEPCAPVRVGYTASRKVGGAVVRNRAKRRLRVAAAQALPRWGRSGWDYVLIARPGATAILPFAQLVRNLTDAIREVHSRTRRQRKGARA